MRPNQTIASRKVAVFSGCGNAPGAKTALDIFHQRQAQEAVLGEELGAFLARVKYTVLGRML